MVELLCPASNSSHIDLAIKYKADAVYGGLKNWNARHKNINFTATEYNKAVTALHENNIKFYLTLNTLLLDHEIRDILKFLHNKNNELPDAFIVADIGLMRCLKEFYPSIPIHASTQFGAHNTDDIKLLESIGVNRVIIARELTLDELRNVVNTTNIEVECFVWGSQCISFSGLCFLGSMFNGGSGNRGKCIITCRDLYTANSHKGHLLYTADLNCINLVNSLKEIKSIKIEGRRRDVSELEKVIKEIRESKTFHMQNGYLKGISVKNNKLFEPINSRTTPLFKAIELLSIDKNDVFMEFKSNKPVKYSSYDDVNAFYVFSEIKNEFKPAKRNISFEISIRDKYIVEVLCINSRGEGITFKDYKDKYISFDFGSFIKIICEISKEINIYKVKYKRNRNNKYMISKKMLNDIIKYVENDCVNKFKLTLISQKIKLNTLYVETDNDSVVNTLFDNKDITIIYDIADINNMKNIKSKILLYGNKVIYKLPLFNWSSKDLFSKYKLLTNKDVMFTRLSQLYLSNDFNFQNKHTDYTIYVWNTFSLMFLKRYEINFYTASPELNYFQNSSILRGKKTQFIIGGKMPLSHTRSCFQHIYDCNVCPNDNRKTITNIDKNMSFDIICRGDHRVIINNELLLDDYTMIPGNSLTTYRYIATGQNIQETKEAVDILMNNDYMTAKESDMFKLSYNLNQYESRC